MQKGGVLLTATDTSSLALSLGFADGISTQNANKVKIVGPVLGTRLVDDSSPVAYGYEEKGAAYCDNGPIFLLSSIAGQRGRRRLGPEMHARPTGRGGIDDPDFDVGRVRVEVPEEPKSEIWESPPVMDEQKRNGFRVIPPANRPRVIFRYADSKDLLISGLVEGGDEIAQHPAVVDAPSGKGHVVLFSINPVYRGETWGTYSMVLNTLLNFDSPTPAAKRRRSSFRDRGSESGRACLSAFLVSAYDGAPCIACANRILRYNPATMPKRKAKSRKSARPKPRKKAASGGKLPKDAVTLIVILRPREGQEILLEAELRALIGPTRKEEGCITFDLHRAVEPPGGFLLHEVWASRDAHTEHMHTPHFLRWNARKDALISARDGTFWRQIA